MKLLQLLENMSPQFPTTKEEVEAALNKYGIKNYTINDDLSVDVDGNVNLTDRNLKSLPVKFGKVAGNFICGYNQLVALEGAPRGVAGDFKCKVNPQLKSLDGIGQVRGQIFKDF